MNETVTIYFVALELQFVPVGLPKPFPPLSSESNNVLLTMIPRSYVKQ